MRERKRERENSEEEGGKREERREKEEGKREKQGYLTIRGFKSAFSFFPSSLYFS